LFEFILISVYHLILFRRETIRVLGLLGALDPYKHKMNLGKIDSQIESTALLSMTDSRPIAETEWTTSEMLVNMSSSTLEEYYPAVAITTLIRIIRDPNLFQHHTMVVQVSNNGCVILNICIMLRIYSMSLYICCEIFLVNNFFIENYFYFIFLGYNVYFSIIGYKMCALHTTSHAKFFKRNSYCRSKLQGIPISAVSCAY